MAQRAQEFSDSASAFSRRWKNWSPFINAMIVVFAFVLILYWQDRLQTTTQKRLLVREVTKPEFEKRDARLDGLDARISDVREVMLQVFELHRESNAALRQHEAIGAHQAMDQRASAIEERVRRIEAGD